MTKNSSYEKIYQQACQRKGGEKPLAQLLHQPLPAKKLAAKADAAFLSEFSKKVFQSGFVWKVVEAKWPNYEELFWGFDTEKLLMMSDEMLEQRAADKRLIRNMKKIWGIRENAYMMDDTRRREGVSFAQFVADWPGEDITGLWAYLKKHGTRLGGNTGPYALRALGKDTFLFTRDVEDFLRANNIIDTGITTKSAHRNAQVFFNELKKQSGKSLAELSQIVAYSYGVNRHN